MYGPYVGNLNSANTSIWLLAEELMIKVDSKQHNGFACLNKTKNACPDSYFLCEKDVETNFQYEWVVKCKQKSGSDNAASINDLSSWPCFTVSAFLFGA